MTGAVADAPSSLAPRLVAEGGGTVLLLAIVVGSGIMAERLAQGNSAIALLANAIATGVGLYVLITTLGPVSGAHFNPVVTIAAWLRRNVTAGTALAYVGVQCLGAVAGVALAHAMFDEPLLQIGIRERAGASQWLSEFLATFGLLTVIFGAAGRSIDITAARVAAYITAAYWFTASTSFANPAVTLARSLTTTFAGIQPGDAPGFILAQLLALPAALLFLRVCLEHRSPHG